MTSPAGRYPWDEEKNRRTLALRLDADLLRWFRQQRGYQTRINAILRAYMKAQFSIQ
jgi:uncharacterized protein (DUF4415 family)